MSCSCASSPCNCESLTIAQGPRGFRGEPGPPVVLTFTGVTLPPGDPTTVTQSGGAGAYTIELGIAQGATGAQGPAGANGTNGIAYTTLTSPFTQPAIGDLVTITVGSTAFMTLGQPIFVEQGGSYLAASNPLSATQIIVRNPGPAEGYASGVLGNATPGVIVPVSGGLAQVTSVGRPGRDGTPGTAGPAGAAGSSAIIGITTTIPTLPPSPGGEAIVYTDSLTTPTIFRFYFYSGGSWSAGPNIIGAAGTLIVSTAGDPNVTLPAGPVGTYAFRTDVPSLYLKTGAVTWALQFTFVPAFAQVAAVTSGLIDSATVYTNRVVGFTPLTDTHNAPGTYTFDLQYQGVQVAADKDLELDWDDTNFLNYAQWQWEIENLDASPINLTYASTQFQKKTGLVLPATLAAGAIQVYKVIKTGGGITIEDTYVTVAV